MEGFLVFVRTTAAIVSTVAIDSPLVQNKSLVLSLLLFNVDPNLCEVETCMRRSCALSWEASSSFYEWQRRPSELG
jgi:hypothetical protein